MKITLYKIEDFRAAIAPESTVLYDLTVDSKANPIPVARISFSLFGVSLAGDIVEYSDDTRISLLSIVGENFEDEVNEALRKYRTFASDEFGAKPGRYDELPNTGRQALSPGMFTQAMLRIERVEEDLIRLNHALLRYTGGYDD